MSYILDALKRADSEREREREDVPGLHSKTDTWVAPDEVRTGSSQRLLPLVWALLGTGLLLALGMLWLFLSRDAAPASPSTSAAPVTAPAAAPPPALASLPQAAAPALVTPPPAAVAAMPAPAPAPALPPIARALPPVTTTHTPTRAARTVDAAVAAVAAQPPVAKAKAEARSVPLGEPAPAPAPLTKAVPTPAPAPAPTASAATSVDARLYTLSELPEDVRAGLPALTVGGAMYSQTPANRMLIINGQVFREGDTLAPGLVLEQIKLKSAVLKVKGLRYGISY